MSHQSSTAQASNLMFQLKGGLYPLTALQLLGNDLAVFETQLQAKIDQAPKFFLNAPVVIDLQKFQPQTALLDYKRLIDILLTKKLIPVGVKGGLAEQQALATLAGLPILQDNAKETSKSEEVTESAAVSTPSEKQSIEIKGNHYKIIDEPIRSGQQLYVRGGDLVVHAPVSQGSELLADGNIHIYGPLRGRALAGVGGDQDARIFCHSLEAELISIAGQYKISEDIDPQFWQQPVAISIQSGRLHIRLL